MNIAEPRALIGFAGPRVIETTIRQTLPEGFQRSEFLLEHGMIDRITSRLQMRKEIALLVSHLQRSPEGEKEKQPSRERQEESAVDIIGKLRNFSESGTADPLDCTLSQLVRTNRSAH